MSWLDTNTQEWRISFIGDKYQAIKMTIPLDRLIVCLYYELGSNELSGTEIIRLAWLFVLWDRLCNTVEWIQKRRCKRDLFRIAWLMCILYFFVCGNEQKRVTGNWTMSLNCFMIKQTITRDVVFLCAIVDSSKCIVFFVVFLIPLDSFLSHSYSTRLRFVFRVDFLTFPNSCPFSFFLFAIICLYFCFNASWKKALCISIRPYVSSLCLHVQISSTCLRNTTSFSFVLKLSTLCSSWV